MFDFPPSGARAETSGRHPAKGGLSLLTGAVVLAILLLSGCATKGDLRDVRDEIVELQGIAARQDSILRAVLTLQRAMDDSLGIQSGLIFQMRGDLNRQMLAVQEQLVMIQELTGQGQRALAGLRDQIEARRTAIVEEERDLARDDVEPDAGADVGGGADDDPMPGVRGRPGPEEMYNVAIGQFNRGSVTTARRAFEQFLTTYPNHPLAPDAHFYLADILVQENRIEDAVQAFLEIPELFPTADRVPDALYRAGALQQELGNTDDARLLFERVVNSYPDSGVAILAEERLDDL